MRAAMTSTQLRIGVVGAGHFGRFHALKVAASAAQRGRARLTGIHDVDQARAETVAAEAAALGRIDRPDIESILRLAPHVVPLNFVRAVHRRVTGANPHFTEEILRGERLHHVGTMTGAIIHDFKTPLTAIRCACDLLETQAHDGTHRRMAEVIKRSVERMMAMTQELLDYTLGGSAPLEFEPLTVKTVAGGVGRAMPQRSAAPRHRGRAANRR